MLQSTPETLNINVHLFTSEVVHGGGGGGAYTPNFTVLEVQVREPGFTTISTANF